MSASGYLSVLRRHWRLVAQCLVVGIALAVAANVLITPKYEASAQLFVSTKDTGTDLSSLAQGGQFTQARVQSYAQIVNSPEVARDAATRLGGTVSAHRIAQEVSATAPPNTVLIDVHVSDVSASRASLIANAVSDAFAAFVNTLEANGTAKSPVNVTVVRQAQTPSKPASPRQRLDLILGVLLGAFAGVFAAALREALDRRVKDREQLQHDLQVPVLAAIGYDRDARRHPLTVQADPHSSRAEAFRQLRTSLQFVNVDASLKSIAVTSSVPDEGKTTTGTNLAITLGQSGMRVLLVEGDLRRPRIADYLGIEGNVGLTSVLIGRARAADAIQQWGKESPIDVLASGPIPPNPSELLGSQAMMGLIAELEENYDLVVIDAPPLLPVTDATVLSKLVGGTLMVVRYGSTKREQVARAVESLRAVGATVLGIVLTMTPNKGPDAEYYGHRYSYGDRRRRGQRRDTTELVTPVPSSVRTVQSAPPTPNDEQSVATAAVDAEQPRSDGDMREQLVGAEDPVEFFLR